MTRLMPLMIALLGAVALAIVATTPPRPLPKDAPASAFSAGRAMDHVRAMAAQPHPTGSPANTRVREHLVERLAAMGLEVTTDAATVSELGTKRLNRMVGSEAPPPQLVNVIAVLPGLDRTKPALALMAHYDSVGGSPGAADDIAGVASILETLRALKDDGTPSRDVIALITDAEELGLEGAEHFFASHPLKDNIGTIINMEARGGGGRTSMFETSDHNGEAIRVYRDNVSRPSGTSLSVFIYRLLPNDTDLTPALKGPYTAYNFAFIGRPGLYHSPLATPARLDQGSLQDMGSQVLSLSRALLDKDDLPQKSPDLVFFDVFGIFTIAYPPVFGWAMLGITLLAFGGALWSRVEGQALLRGIGYFVSIAIIGGTFLYLGNLVSGADGPVNYYDRLAAIPRLEIMALLSGVAAALIVLRKGGFGPNHGAGFALGLLALGILGQMYAPTAAYVVIVPLMLASVSALVVTRIGGTAGSAVAAVIATLVTGYMISLGHQMMQGVGADIPMAAILPLVLSVLVLLPLWPATGTRRTLGASGVLLLVMVAIALWVRLDPIAETAAAYG